MKVNVHNQTDQDVKEAIKIIKKIFRKVKDKSSMEIIFISQDEIHRMNQTFRSIDRPTDVLSFPNDDLEIKSLGDIFISLEQAKIQAESLGHSEAREIGFLAVHGYLHLKGYDHHSETEEKAMILEQEKILNRVNLKRS